MLRSLDLPLEVRGRIYEYLVVGGKVFYIPGTYATESELRFEYLNMYHAPSLQILHVCKQILGEAKAIYASKNNFVLPHYWHSAHKTSKTELALCWLYMLRQLYDLQDGSTTLDLDFLELDVMDAYCPMDCCRILKSGSTLTKVLTPKKSRLLRLTGNEEGVILRECDYRSSKRTDDLVLSEDEAEGMRRVG
ncbi:hypothetical protein E8E11_003254 [Didymella keratinophila]|nr:hypothetical protein E8E11_003254 [Didymella keratinophila]